MPGWYVRNIERPFTHSRRPSQYDVSALGQHWFNCSLAHCQRQAITWTNTDLLSVGPRGTSFSETLFKENVFENIVRTTTILLGYDVLRSIWCFQLHSGCKLHQPPLFCPRRDNYSAITGALRRLRSPTPDRLFNSLFRVKITNMNVAHYWTYVKGIHCITMIMSPMASQITSLTIVYSTVYWGGDQRKHQSSVSLAFVRGIHQSPVNSPHNGPVTRKMFPLDDVIMNICASSRDPNGKYFHSAYVIGVI